jgi:hypothetical protein
MQNQYTVCREGDTENVRNAHIMQQPFLHARNGLGSLWKSKNSLKDGNSQFELEFQIHELNLRLSEKEEKEQIWEAEKTELNQTLSQYKQNLIDNQIVIKKMMLQLKRLDGLRISQAEVIRDLRKLVDGEHRTVGG